MWRKWQLYLKRGQVMCYKSNLSKVAVGDALKWQTYLKWGLFMCEDESGGR